MKTATKQQTKLKHIIAISTMAMVALAFAALFSSKQVNAAGYQELGTLQNTSDPEKVEVLEFFWLGCPHCYSLEPSLVAWHKNMPDNVVFVREAPALNPSWEQHSRGFYAAKFMGKEDEFVEAMYEAIHEKKQRMRSPKDIAKLAEGLGLDKDKFLSTMNSFAVNGKLSQSKTLAGSVGIRSVPSVVINGKYLTSPSIAGGHAELIETINERIAFEKKEMGLE